MIALVGTLLATPPASPDDRRPSLISGATFVLPGAYYAHWTPAPSTAEATDGGGFEISVAHHFEDARWLVGALANVETVRRWRAAAGIEAGFEYVGVEVSVARELARGDVASQWSLQIAPYVSVGFANVVARWVVGLSARANANAPGDGAMIIVGFKVPIPML